MRSKLPYIIVAVLFLGYILLETLGPKPHDWSVSYGQHESKPFGSKLLYERLPDLFPEADIKAVEQSPAKVLAEFEAKPSNYIILAGELDMGTQDAHALLDFARRGNSVFIAAEMFTGPFADSLGIENKEEFLARTENLFATAPKGNSLSFKESGGSGDDKEYPLIDYVHYNHWPAYSDGEALSTNKEGYPVYKRYRLGDGQVLVHSVPLAFTNYYMVDPVNHAYISKALSYLPEQNVIWDDHFKPGRVDLDSSVSYLLGEPALKWAWIMLLCTLVVYIVFEGKRRQRIIPLQEPVTNTTLEFTQTVSRLYLGHADHKDIAEKKIKFFLEYVRNRWLLPTHDLSDQFEFRLASKSNVTLQEVQELCTVIRGIQNVKAIDAHTLMLLNRKIESFYVNSQ